VREERVTLHVPDQSGWTQWLAALRPGFERQLSGYALPDANEAAFERLKAEEGVTAFVCPRGIGPDAWGGDERKQTQIRRRFMLLGQTLDGMRVWDLRRAIQATRQLDSIHGWPLGIQAHGEMAGIALYASLFEPGIGRLDLVAMPATHMDGPTLLNVLRYLDLPQALAMAAEHTDIQLWAENPSDWQFAQMTHERLGWDRELQILPNYP